MVLKSKSGRRGQLPQVRTGFAAAIAACSELSSLLTWIAFIIAQKKLKLSRAPITSTASFFRFSGRFLLSSLLSPPRSTTATQFISASTPRKPLTSVSQPCALLASFLKRELAADAARGSVMPVSSATAKQKCRSWSHFVIVPTSPKSTLHSIRILKPVVNVFRRNASAVNLRSSANQESSS